MSVDLEIVKTPSSMPFAQALGLGGSLSSVALGSFEIPIAQINSVTGNESTVNILCAQAHVHVCAGICSCTYVCMQRPEVKLQCHFSRATFYQ